MVGVEVEEVKGLEAGIKELSTAHPLLTGHSLRHTAHSTVNVSNTQSHSQPDLSLESMLTTLKDLVTSATNLTAPTSHHQLQLSRTLP